MPYTPDQVRRARWRLDQMLPPRPYVMGVVLGLGLLLFCAGGTMMWGEREFGLRPWGPPWIPLAGGGILVAASIVFRTRPPKSE